ncbi:hypothetical protein ACFV8E_17705 [Streptomyces sp. NPDC059849]|uniref:hypothetical protein n=1 Tax=Streptomyces sp. NPDC059849 TaxID=3346969 RepID=UPI003662DF3D
MPDLNVLMDIQMESMVDVTALGDSVGLRRQVVREAITVSGFATPATGLKARRPAVDRCAQRD